MSEYAKRDHAALGAHYVRHISAMTAEALHTKSAIAGELAWRDAEIERLRRERDALAARLAEIVAQEPAAWQSRFTDDGGWGYCSEQHTQMVAAAPHEWPGYEVRTLIARPTPAQRVSAADGSAPAAAPERADLVAAERAMRPAV
jgi:hypothetical protein